jgi:ATP-dependent RNA helicase RhlE
MSFQEFGLSEAVVHGVQSMGYIDPTPIQERAIPVILSGKDVMGSAQTGTGKTAAFALPILTLLARHSGMRCLILEPTRELAAQVEESLRWFARFSDLEIGLVHGGVKHGGQRDKLKRGIDVLVATPGRLLDFMEDGTISLSSIRYLVLDEVDRMLDMGFLPQVRQIVEKCPTQRQTLFFSATMPPEIDRMAKWVLKEPEVIEIGQRLSPAETVAHALYPVAKDQKFDLLLEILARTSFDSCIIFSATKVNADRIAARLGESGHPVAVMHADRSQKERTEALDGFKSGRFKLLVATDLAARGLDIAGVSHVINYDVPGHPEDYVHRIGRTGRAQTTGEAFTIFSAEDTDAVRAIEGFIGSPIERRKLEGFSYLFTMLLNGGPARPARSKASMFMGARRRR